MIDEAARRGRELFESGLLCAESVLLAIAEEKQIQSDLIPKIATGFCSGVARTCRMCGAVSGAVMGIGLLTGRDSTDDSIEPAYALVRELIEKFTERFGSTNCQELLGYDVGTEDGMRFYEENNGEEECREYTEEATRMTLELLEEHLQ